MRDKYCNDTIMFGKLIALFKYGFKFYDQRESLKDWE